MKFFTEVNTFYPIPSFKFTYEISEKQKRFVYLDIEIVWLKWGASIGLIAEE